MATHTDEYWMAEALSLARQAEGRTRPNPPVGAVIVRRNRLVGRGFTRPAGGAHAEIVALRSAAEKARGATLYVTLEPCSTQGRTGPCTDAILESGLARVVFGTSDPNPIHAGQARRILRRKGLDVKSGTCRADASDLVAPFRKWILTGMPFVTLKLAMSMDGMIADFQGRSKWITGPAARRRVQALRRRADAILVGASTARMDDPSLLPRPACGRRPLRVIVGGAGRLPAALRLFNDTATDRTLVAHPAAFRRQYAGLEKRTGVGLIPIASGNSARIPINRLLKELAARDVLHVLCEGGGGVASSLVRANAVDEYQFFYAPCLLGGGATTAISGTPWSLKSRPHLRILEQERIGDDLWIRARPGTTKQI